MSKNARKGTPNRRQAEWELRLYIAGETSKAVAAFANLQQAEFASEARGYTATRHQREVGAGYFDAVAMAISGGAASTTALQGSTEQAQFTPPESALVGVG